MSALWSSSGWLCDCHQTFLEDAPSPDGREAELAGQAPGSQAGRVLTSPALTLLSFTHLQVDPKKGHRTGTGSLPVRNNEWQVGIRKAV